MAIHYRCIVIAVALSLFYGCGANRESALPPADGGRTPQSIAVTAAGTWTGTVASLFTGGFTLQSSACGYVHVYTTSATQILPAGSKVSTGEPVSVSGTGSCATSISAISVTVTVATPSTGVPTHVMTADYMYGSYGRAYGAYTATLTWGQTYVGTAVAQAGIKTMYYTDPNRQEPTDPLYTADETTFAHDCNHIRIYSKARPTQDLMDPHSSHLTTLWQNQIAGIVAKNHFDALFDDEPDDFYGLSGTPCNFSSQDWFNATVAQMRAIPHPFIYNGLSEFGPNNSISPLINLNSVSIGGMMEDCYGSKFNPHLITTPQWQTVENTQLAMARAQKLFFCYESILDDASTSQAARTYAYASFMLTFNQATSVLWEYFKTASGYHVEPESQLVPTTPLVATVSDISTLHVSGGTYVREYAHCYIAARSVGPCAAIVNADLVAHPYTLGTKYGHTIVLSGGGILDGGTIATNGAAPPSSVPAHTGVIAFQ